MFKKLKINCNQATTICNKNQYGEATLFDKIKLNIHFLHCKFCLLYTKQNMTLTRLFKGHAQRCKELKNCLSAEDKELLKKSLENKNT